MTTWPSNMMVKPIKAWPGQMTARRQRSNFGAPQGATIALLTRELRQLNAKNVVLQVAIDESQFRIDGYPRATAKAEHPGIILSMDTSVGLLSYPCDRFDRWEDNLRGIALALEALRKVDRYGVTKRGEQYSGFKAIGSGAIAVQAAMTPGEADAVLTDLTGLDLFLPDDRGIAFRRAQRMTHPDHGGSAEAFDRVMRAGRALGLTT